MYRGVPPTRCVQSGPMCLGQDMAWCCTKGMGGPAANVCRLVGCSWCSSASQGVLQVACTGHVRPPPATVHAPRADGACLLAHVLQLVGWSPEVPSQQQWLLVVAQVV